MPWKLLKTGERRSGPQAGKPICALAAFGLWFPCRSSPEITRARTCRSDTWTTPDGSATYRSWSQACTWATQHNEEAVACCCESFHASGHVTPCYLLAIAQLPPAQCEAHLYGPDGYRKAWQLRLGPIGGLGLLPGGSVARNPLRPRGRPCPWKLEQGCRTLSLVFRRRSWPRSRRRRLGPWLFYSVCCGFCGLSVRAAHRRSRHRRRLGCVIGRVISWMTEGHCMTGEWWLQEAAPAEGWVMLSAIGFRYMAEKYVPLIPGILFEG